MSSPPSLRLLFCRWPSSSAAYRATAPGCCCVAIYPALNLQRYPLSDLCHSLASVSGSQGPVKRGGLAVPHVHTMPVDGGDKEFYDPPPICETKQRWQNCPKLLKPAPSPA